MPRFIFNYELVETKKIKFWKLKLMKSNREKDVGIPTETTAFPATEALKLRFPSDSHLIEKI